MAQDIHSFQGDEQGGFSERKLLASLVYSMTNFFSFFGKSSPEDAFPSIFLGGGRREKQPCERDIPWLPPTDAPTNPQPSRAVTSFFIYNVNVYRVKQGIFFLV